MAENEVADPSEPDERAPLSMVESTFQDALSRTYGDGGNPNVEVRAESAEHIVSARIAKLVAEARPHQRYILEGEVGRGGMGAVLKIFDTDLRRSLAMKVILRGGTQTSGETPRGLEPHARLGGAAASLPPGHRRPGRDDRRRATRHAAREDGLGALSTDAAAAQRRL
ncbi:MAG: hypothetical protein GY711_09165 [bacterium]|nr:hypothetical protein [bacterium]